MTDPVIDRDAALRPQGWRNDVLEGLVAAGWEPAPAHQYPSGADAYASWARWIVRPISTAKRRPVVATYYVLAVFPRARRQRQGRLQIRIGRYRVAHLPTANSTYYINAVEIIWSGRAKPERVAGAILAALTDIANLIEMAR